ncbi:MAG TPA: N-acetyltransferase [Hyphomicrobiaceae bacterium]|nr:N-acetyltransferase [Hyphomicrobiaceae bacterium]
MAIRLELATDVDRIGTLITAAFLGAPHTSGTEAAIVERLREAGALTLSLVEEQNGRLVGHVAFSPVEITATDERWFGLGPLAVEPEYRCRGIGGALVREGLRRLRTARADGCVVLGDPSYYSRFGFLRNPCLHLANAPPEYVLCLSISGAEPVGFVKYHAAFGA